MSAGYSVPPSRFPLPDDQMIADLVRAVARRDTTAFTQLWASMSGAIAVSLRPTLPDQADVIAVTAATFAEVWWMAPHHVVDDSEPTQWIMAIAHHRGIERQRGHGAVASSTGPNGAAQPWTTAANDETIELDVSSLIIASLARSTGSP